MIWLWIIIGIVGFIIWIALILLGISFCNNNDGFVIVMLFLSLNILGIIIGWAILWNNRRIEDNTFWKKNDIETEDIKNMNNNNEKNDKIAERYRQLRLKKRNDRIKKYNK